MDVYWLLVIGEQGDQLSCTICFTCSAFCGSCAALSQQHGLALEGGLSKSLVNHPQFYIRSYFIAVEFPLSVSRPELLFLTNL